MDEATVTMSVAKFDNMRDKIKELDTAMDNLVQELNDAIDQFVPTERRQYDRYGISLVKILTDEIQFLQRKVHHE